MELVARRARPPAVAARDRGVGVPASEEPARERAPATPAVEVRLVSCSAQRVLASGYRGRVWGRYAHGIVALDGRRPLHLTTQPDRLGPFSLWIDPKRRTAPWDLEDISPLSELTARAGDLYLGGRRFALERAGAWEPEAGWGELARRFGTWNDIAGDLAQASAPERTDLVSDRSWTWLEARRSAFRRAMRHHDSRAAQAAARALAGLGPGLTPAGDDYLAGVLLGLRAIPWRPPRMSCAVLRAAAGTTSELSIALLTAAARGEAALPWHGLVQALVRSDPLRARCWTDRIAQIGHSSGIWSLTGFFDTVLDASEGAGSPPPPR